MMKVSDTSVVLVWSVHDEAEAVYADALRRICAAKPNVDFRLHATAEKGHLDPGDLRLDGPLARHSVFLCGPVPMRRGLVRRLTSLGVPRSQVFFEEFRLR